MADKKKVKKQNIQNMNKTGMTKILQKSCFYYKF